MTATPRKPRITFPENPFDGQQVTEIIDDASCVIWTYEAETNSWKYQIYGLPQEVIYTDQVLVRDNAGEARETDPTKLKTQKDVNWYLAENAGGSQYTLLEANRIKPIDPQAMTTYEGSTTHPQSIQTRTSVEEKLESLATKDELAALQAQVDNLSGLMIQARYEQGTGITTRPGQFVCVANNTQQNRFSQGDELKLYETDLDQKAPALTRVIVGDYINIVEPTTGLSCQLHVTQSMGVVIKYDYMVGTLDRISDRVPYEFRISGTA